MTDEELLRRKALAYMFGIRHREQYSDDEWADLRDAFTVVVKQIKEALLKGEKS